ncbi:MAG: Hpt domain-containing protein, partial [Byssovorax sp.]
MAGDHELLAELRDIFREELADHVLSIQRQRAVLERPDAEASARGSALAEIHRSIHSLKGAAGAVDYRAVEQFCHALETRLALTKQGAESDPAYVAALASIAHEALHACSVDLAAGRAPAEAAFQEAQRRMTLVQRAPTLPPPRPAPEAPRQVAVEPPPAPLPVETKDAAPEVRGPAERAPAERAPETVRVSPARLGELLSTSEEMLALAGRHTGAATQWKPLDDALVDLRDDLRRARHTMRAEGLERAPGGEEVIRRLERALSSMHGLAAWSIERQRDDTAAWQASAALASEIAERSRALRVVPFGSLEPALERAMRDAGAAVGKEVELRLRGG